MCTRSKEACFVDLGSSMWGTRGGVRGWLLGSPESWDCTALWQGRDFWPSSVSLSTTAKILGPTGWPPLVSPSSEAGLPFVSVLGVTSSSKAQWDLDGVGAYLGTWLNRALTITMGQYQCEN